MESFSFWHHQISIRSSQTSLRSSVHNKHKHTHFAVSELNTGRNFTSSFISVIILDLHPAPEDLFLNSKLPSNKS